MTLCSCNLGSLELQLEAPECHTLKVNDNCHMEAGKLSCLWIQCINTVFLGEVFNEKFFVSSTWVIITGPPNRPVLFSSQASVVCRRLSLSVTQPAGGQAGRRARGRSGGRHCTAGQYGYVPLG